MIAVKSKSQKLRIVFIIGAIIIVIALLIWVIPSIMLGNIETRILSLESQTLRTDSENTLLFNLQTSRGWWVIMQRSTFEPIGIVILVIGFLVIVYGLIIGFL